MSRFGFRRFVQTVTDHIYAYLIPSSMMVVFRIDLATYSTPAASSAATSEAFLCLLRSVGSRCLGCYFYAASNAPIWVDTIKCVSFSGMLDAKTCVCLPERLAIHPRLCGVTRSQQPPLGSKQPGSDRLNWDLVKWNFRIGLLARRAIGDLRDGQPLVCFGLPSLSVFRATRRRAVR